MSYADDLDYFARALSTLIARDERVHRTDRTPLPIALASRDIALTRLRTMCGLVTGTGPTLEDFLARHITTDPGGALYSALADLPLLGGEDRPGLVELLTAPRRPGQKEWQELARAALFLEPYSDALPDLPGPFAWKVVGDIANLASGLPSLDDDLHHHRGVRPVDPGRQGALRLAVAQLESVRRNVGGDLHLVHAAPSAVRPVRTISDLAASNADLARLIRRRGADISAPEIRAAARAVAEGLELVQRVYRGTVDEAPSGRYRIPARDVGRGLKQLLLTPLATLNDDRPEPHVRRLGAEISRQFQALQGLCDRIETGADDDSRRAEHARIGNALDGWIRSVPRVVEALDGAVRGAHAERRLLGRVSDSAPPDARQWHPLGGGESGTAPAILEAMRLAREGTRDWPQPTGAGAAARRVTPTLAEPLRTRRASDEAIASHPNQRAEVQGQGERGRSQARSRGRSLPDNGRGTIAR